MRAAATSGPGPDSGESVENVDQFLQAGLAFFSALFDARRDALFDVRPQDGQTDSIQSGLGRRELLQDLHTQTGLLHHPPDPAYLPLDPVEPSHQKLLLGRV